MRIFGFYTKWPKLKKPDFTTFRFRRRDKDWAVGELVQVIYKPRSKGGGEKLGIAQILSSETRWVLNAEDDELKHYGDYFAVQAVTEDEAVLDGFKDRADMVDWIGFTHRGRALVEPMNKLMLRWVNGQ